MANSRADNVHFIDTSGTITGPLKISGIKIVGGGATATVSLKANGDSGGTVIYEATCASSAMSFDHVCMSVGSTGVYATVGGAGAKVYLYLE